jgi:hypothetical protein
MNTWQKYVRNHTKCVDLSKLGMSGWVEELGKTEYVCCIIRWWLSTIESSNYIISSAESISVIPESPYVYIWGESENTCCIMTYQILLL